MSLASDRQIEPAKVFEFSKISMCRKFSENVFRMFVLAEKLEIVLHCYYKNILVSCKRVCAL